MGADGACCYNVRAVVLLFVCRWAATQNAAAWHFMKYEKFP